MSDSLWPHGPQPARLLCPRQGYWSGLPCPPPGDLPDSGIKPISPMLPAWQVDSSPLSLWGSPWKRTDMCRRKLNHFVVHLKLTQRCKSNACQLKKNTYVNFLKLSTLNSSRAVTRAVDIVAQSRNTVRTRCELLERLTWTWLNTSAHTRAGERRGPSRGSSWKCFDGCGSALVETWHMLPPLVSVTPVADSAICPDNIPPRIAN